VAPSETTVGGGPRLAAFRQEVGASAALVLSVDLRHGDLWVSGPEADRVTAARVRHHVLRGQEPDPFVGGFLIGRSGATTAEREFGPGGWAGSALRALCLDAMGVDQLLGVSMGRTAETVHLLLLGRRGRDFPAAAVAEMDRVAESSLSAADLSAFESAPAGTVDRGRQVGLTPREREVLTALGTGRTAYAISALVGCSERTVHRHLQSIYRKLGTHDRQVTVVRARELHLI
jgi:DNA-binding CsgD family transcriptional regulator